MALALFIAVVLGLAVVIFKSSKIKTRESQIGEPSGPPPSNEEVQEPK